MTARSNPPVAHPPDDPGRATPRPDWQALRRPAAVGALALAGCAYVLAVDPNESSVFLPCPLKALTGWDCPGCGMTRAAHALLQGDISRAFDHNVLFIVILPFLAYAFLRWTAGRAGYQLPGVRFRPWMAWAALVVALGFFVVRNLPAFSYLASGA